MKLIKKFLKDIKGARHEVNSRFPKNYILLSSW